MVVRTSEADKFLARHSGQRIEQLYLEEMPWPLLKLGICTPVRVEMHRDLIELLWPLFDKVEVLSIALDRVRNSPRIKG